jgi:hypothetical protein
LVSTSKDLPEGGGGGGGEGENWCFGGLTRLSVEGTRLPETGQLVPATLLHHKHLRNILSFRPQHIYILPPCFRLKIFAVWRTRCLRSRPSALEASFPIYSYCRPCRPLRRLRS